MHFLQTFQALGLSTGLLLSPGTGDSEGNSKTVNHDAAPSPVESERKSKWGGEGSLGPHLSFSGQELQRTADPIGFGIHLFAGGTYADLPLLVGVKFGWTDFLPRRGTYVFGGEEQYWELQRETLWIGPAIRLLPRTWALRPYVEASVGGWFHWIELSPEDAFNPGEFTDGGKWSETATGMYSLGAGVNWKFRKVLTFELSVDYLHGGSSRMPVVTSQNDVLLFDTIQSGDIEQWSFGLGVGGQF